VYHLNPSLTPNKAIVKQDTDSPFSAVHQLWSLKMCFSIFSRTSGVASAETAARLQRDEEQQR